MSKQTFLTRIKSFGNGVAIVDKKKHTYSELLQNSLRISSQIREQTQNSKTKQKRVVFLTDGDFNYCSVQFAAWANAGVSVPLSTKVTPSEVEYFVKDSEADIIVTQPHHLNKFEQVISSNNKLPLIVLDDKNTTNTHINEDFKINQDHEDALVVYTSGTTGNPKGVVHTHASLNSQIQILCDAWDWHPDDRILNVLPLHHVHGIVNVTNCALWSSAVVEMHNKFEVDKVWEALLREDNDPEKITLFMAVPTIYYNLIKHYDENKIKHNKEEIKRRLERLRLMVSGSAALPEPVMERWLQISGHTLLERYGMTEIGMGISNPYHGKRLTGYVGYPLFGVQCALMDLESGTRFKDLPNKEGELLIKSPSMFDRYLNKPQATADTFTDDGWFKTGDAAIMNEDGMYKILGRLSQDIIKKGGYKLSALEIENRILEHEGVHEVCVLGINDEKQGEEVASIIVLKDGYTLDEIKKHCEKQMSHYKIPRKWKIEKEIPRNAMGKVSKKSLKAIFA